MGLAIKQRKKYVSHKKRWDKRTIEEEAVLVNDYALKNKKEIRKAEFLLSKIKDQAKAMNRDAETKEGAQAKAFIEKLKTQGFLNVDATSLDEVLEISLRDILERRLSNLVYKAKLGRTPKQARQFVVHGHVKVAENVVSSPSYLVPLSLETMISFTGTSSLADENHPERNLEMQGGLKEELAEQEETPLVTEHEGDFDKKEAAMDDEEQDEVND